MADGPIVITDYDPSWPNRFTEQSVPLGEALAPWLAGPIEHVGSTSVPDMPAKPVVDMLAPVTSLDEAQAAVAALEPAGWLFWPDDPNRGWRLWFLYPDPDERTHHLHIIEQAHPQAQAMLAFRDALRSSPKRRRDYTDLKRRLAADHAGNRNAYTNAKISFLERTLQDLGIELPPVDSLPE